MTDGNIGYTNKGDSPWQSYYSELPATKTCYRWRVIVKKDGERNSGSGFKYYENVHDPQAAKVTAASYYNFELY